MKTILRVLPLLAVLFLTSCSISIGTSTRCSSVSECYSPSASAVPASAEDLAARLEAASAIDGFPRRDEALSGIAVDAAASGNLDMAKRALSDIVSFVARDNSAAAASRIFLRNGMRSEATEVAQKITSFVLRDQVLQEISK